MPKQELQIVGPIAFPAGTSIVISPDALKLVEDIVAECEAVEQVAGQSSNDAAVELRARAQGLEKKFEETRKALKAPATAFNKSVDLLFQTVTVKLTSEKERLRGLCNVWTTEQARKAQEAELELAKLTTQRTAAVEAGDVAGVREADATAAEVLQQAPPVSTAEGQSVNYKWNIVVNDIDALFAMFPQLCNPPTPRLNDIKAELSRMLATTAEPKLPGITATREIDTRVRST